MKNILGLAFLSVICFADNAWAQPTTGLTKDKMMQIGDERTGVKDSYTALEWYLKVNEIDPDDVLAIYKVASTHDALRDYKASETWYKKLMDADKKKEYPLSRFWYANALKLNEKYDDAILQFITFEKDYAGDKPEYYKKRALLEIEGARWAKNNPNPNEPLEIENMGRNINSPSTEGTAHAFGRERIIFSALRSDSIIFLDEKGDHKHGHIYVSTKTEDGQGWTEAKPYSTSIEKKGFHAVHPTFSPDGTKFYFTRVQLEGNTLSNSRIMYGSVTNDQIGELKELDFNSASYACKDPRVTSIDGKLYLFFSSNMPANSQGGWDIWVA